MPQDKPYQIIVSQSELGAGTRGASQGFHALQKVALTEGDSWLQNDKIIFVPHHNQALKIPLKYTFAKRIEPLYEVFTNISNHVASAIQNNLTPIIISGDHSIATGTIAGIKKAIQNKKLGVIWIDAHADIHTPYTTPTGNMHGMPIAASLGINHHLPNGNKPNEAVKQLWEKIKNISDVNPKIQSENLIYLGLRDTEWQEDKLIKDLNIQVLGVDFIREHGGAKTAETILKKLIDVDYLYISFDVDVLDPTISTATGTPVDKGIYFKEAINLLKGLMKTPKPVCFELVEMNPSKENNCNKMATMGLEILKTVKERFDKI